MSKDLQQKPKKNIIGSWALLVTAEEYYFSKPYNSFVGLVGEEMDFHF